MKWLLPLLFMLFISLHSLSQQNRALMDSLANLLTRNAPQQKANSIYLRSDKEIYFAGEDLWFNAFVLDAQVAELSETDAILYLQLIHQQGDSTVWSEMYPVYRGIAAGHVYLPQTLPEGFYQLKAYTAHSFFSGQPSFSANAAIQIIKNPRGIKNYGSSAEAVPFRKGMPVQFKITPENGKLVAGLQNKVAFKALSIPDGLPVAVLGKLLKNGHPMLVINSFHAGMGQFTFTPEAGASYAIQTEHTPDTLFTLPDVLHQGVLLQLDKNEKDSVHVKIRSSNLPPQTVLLSLQVRGKLQAIASGKLKDSLLIKLPAADLQPGVTVITVYNEQLQPLVTRLAFIHPEKKLNIQFSEVRETYAQKGQVTLKINTTDTDGKPVPAVLSLRVHDQLFADRKNARDIINYYELSTQLNANLYNPAWYFDSTGIERKNGLDLLLQAEGINVYNPLADRMPVLHNSLQAMVVPANKRSNRNEAVSLMMFNYNRTITQVALANSSGTFYLTPDHLSTGRRFFIKYLSEKQHSIEVTDPFKAIKKTEQTQHPVIYTAEKNIILTNTDVNNTHQFLQYGNTLEEVVVKAKARGFGDRYLGYLDSVAKFEGNTDYVGQCGWLNCPACGSGKKPVEGVTYSELTDSKKSQISSHPFSFGANDHRKVAYHYPVYTEEELLKKFNMIITKGFYTTRQYYQPDYAKEDKSVSDTRNSLYWSPLVVTDANGEATVRFYCSDITGRFTGVAEGIGGNGYLGSGGFSFSVR